MPFDMSNTPGYIQGAHPTQRPGYGVLSPQEQSIRNVANAIRGPVGGPHTLMEQAQQQFPILQKLSLGYKYNPGGGQGYLESWPSGEVGSQDVPRPKEFPLNQFGVEIYNPKTRPEDIMGDVASHYLVNTDPRTRMYYQQFRQSFTPSQLGILRDQYTRARRDEGETRGFPEWREASGFPAYFRGYPFKQWPEKTESGETLYEPHQKVLLDSMLGYFKQAQGGE